MLRALLAALLAAPALAAPRVDADGKVTVPTFTVPFSTFASAEARAAFVRSHRAPPRPEPDEHDIAAGRARVESDLAPIIARQRARYAVTITPTMMGGVYTEVIAPLGGTRGPNATRVLVNLHGGGFQSGARVGEQVESIPLAAVMGVTIVAVDYREGPEHKFPAASEDVAIVYRELLKHHRAEDIGIFGSSAGGVLAAEAVAWLDKEHLPRPGAVAILHASASGWIGGDASYTSFRLQGEDGWADGPRFAVSNVDHFSNADVRDPLVAPVWTPDVLARFPPTLILTATRDFAMSAAVHTARRLDELGVPNELAVWDGLPHYFYIDPDLPESRAAYAKLARFFGAHLGGHGQ